MKKTEYTDNPPRDLRCKVADGKGFFSICMSDMKGDSEAACRLDELGKALALLGKRPCREKEVSSPRIQRTTARTAHRPTPPLAHGLSPTRGIPLHHATVAGTADASSRTARPHFRKRYGLHNGRPTEILCFQRTYRPRTFPARGREASRKNVFTRKKNLYL